VRLASSHASQKSSEEVNVPGLQGVGHIALTVTDPKRSADFYNRLFDAQTVRTVEDDIGPLMICVSPAMRFGFRTHPSTTEADRFNPARVGLDHLGFHVADRQQLQAWQMRLDEQGVTNSGIIEDESGLHLNAKDPDDIALEFFYMRPHVEKPDRKKVGAEIGMMPEGRGSTFEPAEDPKAQS
jgi:glyoxylase I family protein